MKGLPKHIATKQDFINLLEMPEYRVATLAKLKDILLLDDDRAIKVLSGSEEDGNLKTKSIRNPLPLYKQRGFASRLEIKKLIEAYWEG